MPPPVAAVGGGPDGSVRPALIRRDAHDVSRPDSTVVAAGRAADPRRATAHPEPQRAPTERQKDPAISQHGRSSSAFVVVPSVTKQEAFPWARGPGAERERPHIPAPERAIGSGHANWFSQTRDSDTPKHLRSERKRVGRPRAFAQRATRTPTRECRHGALARRDAARAWPRTIRLA